MGSWSLATPTGAGGERGWLWFSFSPSPTHFPGTRPHTACPSCSSCPFALSRKRVSFYWGSYTNARSLPKALLSLSGIGELRNNFHPILQWGMFTPGTHLMQGAGSQCFWCPETCWERAAPKGTKVSVTGRTVIWICHPQGAHLSNHKQTGHKCTAF